MTLKEYLKKIDCKPTPWAVENEIAPSVISRYLNGKGIHIENAIKIQNATKKEVSLRDIYGFE